MVNSMYIKEKLFQKGAVVCGIASVERFKDAPQGFHPVDVYPECKSVIVFGIPHSRSTLKAHTTVPYTLVRNMSLFKIDYIAMEMVETLEREHIGAIQIPASDPYDYWDAQERQGRGILSLKHAAVLAGLGVIGKNTLLLNEQYGNLLWLGAILNSVPLTPDPIYNKELCNKECRLCIEACPKQALNGITVCQKLCRENMGKATEGGGWVITCNTCRRICPHSTPE